MVATSDGLAVAVVVKGTVSSSAVGSVDSGASHVGIVALTVVTGTRSKSSVAGGRGSRDSSDFRVTELAVAILALPELAARATSVAVGGARAEALLLLVVTAKEHLHRNRKEEEEANECQSMCWLGVLRNLRSNDGDGETGSVEPAGGTERGRVSDLVTLTVAAKALLGGGGAVAKRSVDIARAAGSTVTGEDGDSDHGTAAKGVEDQAEQSKEGLAAEAAGEDNSRDGVEDSGSRETLNSLLPTRNRNITISLDGKEVGVDSKNDCGTAEL